MTTLDGASDRCAACGNGLRPSARFCDACGAPVKAVAEERKQVTVLFTDVVGSMNMAAVLDPERLREIMHELFNQSAAIVQRYNGTVDDFTGDGLMAMFGAPAALEDHALRACIAAVEIQSLARHLAVVVRQRDDVDLRIRIGLNSGVVIAGWFGSACGRYTATGHTVGLAKRMETAAAPGEILCSGPTARLIEHAARLGPPDQLTVKGVDEPVVVRRLEAIESDRLVMARDDGPLIGRGADLAHLVDVFGAGDASVVTVVGEPGVGKSRLVREFVSATEVFDTEVVITRCEAHTAHVPLRALSRMLRAMFDIRHLDAASARSHIGSALEGVVDAADLDVLFDVLSIGDGAVTAPMSHADARRHRLIAMLSKHVKNRSARTIFVVEDLHWIDSASDEFLAEFAASLTATKSMLVGTFRQEYSGRLRSISDAAITLSPLSESTTVELAAALLGDHPTAAGAAESIARPSAGNPFFVEEIVRDLVERQVLCGGRGSYRVVGDVEAIAVPETVQTVLAARIDRLTGTEKSILNAAAVIGTSFGLTDLRVLVPGVEADQLRSLLSVELIDQIQLLPEPRFAFRHPLVRTVCYESQLTSTRADSHRQLAAAIETRNPAAVEENSGLIAHHLEAAGELAASYTWHMRSGDWLKHRDVVASRDSWERAREIADRLGEVDRRIAPRAQLTATGWLVAADDEQSYTELRELAPQSGDRLSLALGISGRLTSLILTEGRIREAAVMAEELSGLIDEIESPGALTAELLMAVAYAQYEVCAFEQALQTIDRLRAIPDANVDDLAPAAAMAGVIRVMTGRREQGERDLQMARELARDDSLAAAIALGYRCDLVTLGFDVADNGVLDETREILRRAESFGDAYGLSVARFAHGTALARCGDASAGVDLLRLSRADGIDIYGAATDAELVVAMAADDRFEHIDVLRDAIQSGIDGGERLFAGFPVSVLVELLLGRGTPADLAQARQWCAQLEQVTAEVSLQALELWPLLCRARLGKAVGDGTAYTQTVTKYRDLADELDARGHIAIAGQLAAAPTFAG